MLLLFISACSNTKKVALTELNYQTVTVLSSKPTVIYQRDYLSPFRHIGVHVGTGGKHGVYGAFGFPFFDNDRYNTKTATEFIIQKTDKELVVVNQIKSYGIKKGDKVRLLDRHGKPYLIPLKVETKTPKTSTKTTTAK